MCMCMLNKRVQLLFEKSEWKKLEKIAKEKDSSVSSLIRQAVTKVYTSEKVSEQIRKANQTIIALRKVSKEKIDYKELINYGRKY